MLDIVTEQHLLKQYQDYNVAWYLREEAQKPGWSSQPSWCETSSKAWLGQGTSRAPGELGCKWEKQRLVYLTAPQRCTGIYVASKSHGNMEISVLSEFLLQPQWHLHHYRVKKSEKLTICDHRITEWSWEVMAGHHLLQSPLLQAGCPGLGLISDLTLLVGCWFPRDQLSASETWKKVFVWRVFLCLFALLKICLHHSFCVREIFFCVHEFKNVLSLSALLFSTHL